jgi:hypothetical protein
LNSGATLPSRKFFLPTIGETATEKDYDRRFRERLVLVVLCSRISIPDHKKRSTPGLRFRPISTGKMVRKCELIQAIL